MLRVAPGESRFCRVQMLEIAEINKDGTLSSRVCRYLVTTPKRDVHYLPHLKHSAC